MKNRITRVLASVLLAASSVALYAKLSYSEILEHREQSVKDYKSILSALAKAGYTEKDSPYKRVNRSLRRSETLLAHMSRRSVAKPTTRKKKNTNLAKVAESKKTSSLKKHKAKPKKTKKQ